MNRLQEPAHVTQLLLAWRDGNAAALDQLAPLVESELHRLAVYYLRGELAGHTLQATALVNEAYLRLIDWKAVNWTNRAHFFAVAGKIMRHVLVDCARQRNRLRRGGNLLSISFADMEAAGETPSLDVIALDAALNRLAAFDPRKSQIVEVRFFGGLTEDETAEVLHIPLRTLQREWKMARAWLYRELKTEKSTNATPPGFPHL
jgi:RNA polymerase sigma factor (TIGR02999 family)